MQERIAFFTQKQNTVAPDGTLGGFDLPSFVRDMSVGNMPHLGAGIIMSEASSLGFETDLHPLSKVENIDWEEFARTYDLLMFSAIDRGVDDVRTVLRRNPKLQNRTVIGGQGISPITRELGEEFPQVTIVSGRAEGTVSQLLEDFRSQRGMDSIYRTSPDKSDLRNFGEHPAMDPRFTFRDKKLFKGARLKPVELSTGCTQACEFCPISGEPITIKPLDVAIKEIEMMGLRRRDMLVLVDHNLFNLPRDYLTGLFNYIKNQGIFWVGEGTISQVIDQDKLLSLMASNCISLLCGLEDINSEFEGSPMKQKLSRNFPETLQRLRNVGLPVTWSLVFPLDSQTRKSYLKTADFVKRYKLNVNSHLLQPRYGSPLREQLLSENRLLSDDSRLRDGIHLVFEPEQMTGQEALAGYIWLKEKITSLPWLTERFRENLTTGGIRYAAALTAIELTADWMSVFRMKRMYPGLKDEIKRYEAEWKKRSF